MEKKTVVRHVILWKLKEELSGEALENVKSGIKSGLEGLAGLIPGLLNICVHHCGLPSSNADLMLECVFSDEAALKGYAVHPAHVKVANEKVRPFTQVRLCLDFEE